MDQEIVQKVCSSCKRTLPVSTFTKSAQYRDGYRGQCTPCRSAYMRQRRRDGLAKRSGVPQSPENRRRSALKSKYGITIEQFSAMIAEQGGGCGICGAVESTTGRFKTLAVDHCHASGVVRGILCHRCNVTLGLLGDNRDGIERFARYLNRD